jgi:TolB protein
MAYLAAAKLLFITLLTVSVTLVVGRLLPSASQILLERDRVGFRDLILADAGRNLMVALQRTPRTIEENPAWSPDGGRIVYVLQPYDALRRLCVRPFAGQPTCRVPRNLWDDHPRWSPDGSTILFESLDERTGVELYTLRGGRVFPLTDAYGNDAAGAWAVDGAWVAFNSMRGGLRQVYLAPPMGGAALRVSDAGANALRPVPSPDGRWLAYVTDVNFTEELLVVPTSCLPQPDTCAAQSNRLIAHNGLIDNVVWSPDSAQIAYVSNHSGSYEIYTLEFATGIETRWTDNVFVDEAPQWSPDGSALAYVSNRDGRIGVYIQTGAHDAARALTPDDGYEYWSPQWRPE